MAVSWLIKYWPTIMSEQPQLKSSERRLDPNKRRQTCNNLFWTAGSRERASWSKRLVQTQHEKRKTLKQNWQSG